jgi:2-aminoethylphosphonate-pyruvate transaminase
MLLLNPGPVTLTERVRNSLLQTDLCHRESEFFDLQEEARTRLVDLYGLDAAEWQAVLMTGSGTAAVESMTAALVPQNGKLLVIENGVYGERIAQIATQYGIAHETTTGRLNDLAALGELCRARGLRLLVDGVSSFGAEAIDFADTSLDAVAATANKCLHGVPGASFVLVRRAALAQAASRTYYLDLGRLARLQDQRNTPFTPSVHAYYALVEALREIADEGGWHARHQRYAALAEQARVGLAERGMASVLPPEQSSVVLRAYRLPEGIAYPQLHDALKARGFVIYAGQGGLSAELFRISTMGNIHAADIERLLQGFSDLMR